MEHRSRTGVLAGHLQPTDSNNEQSDVHQVPTSSSVALTPEQSGKEYAVVLPERLSDAGPWNVRRSIRSPERLVTRWGPPHEHVATLFDNLESSASEHANIPFLGQRAVDEKGQPGPYQWLTYAEAAEQRTHIGSGLLQHGLAPGNTVGLYSVNHRDWALVDAASHAYSMISVPLYDTLGPDAVTYICQHAELAAVACSIDVLDTLLKCLPECPTVQLVIVIALRPGQHLPAIPAAVHARVCGLADLARMGAAKPRPHIPPSPEDVATICYTSGTTGTPKGVVLTHGSLIADSAAHSDILNMVEPGDRHISYLPLAHIYERMNFTGAVHWGFSVGFYRGDVLLLLEDILELKPQIFASVPRLWNRIYDRVMGTIQAGNPISRALFHQAFASKKAAFERGDMSGGKMAPFWNRLVFSKIKARLGGQVKYLCSGASPISKDVFDFLRICFDAEVVEGYGMTETACTITLMEPGDPISGHVGAPLPCVEVKLDDIPEMGYTNADQPYPRGEICVRGPTIFRGYYKNEEATREVLDADGWLHTGDVGMWWPGGRLKIIDRKKNIFKLAQGEYIAPEKIENVYQRSPLVAQAFVHGDSLKPQLVAIVVPDPEALLPWAAARKLPQDLTALCKDKNVTAAVLKSMQEEGRAAQLRGFEQVAAIVLTPDPFSIENNMLTPTFKLKRPQAKKAFEKDIVDMYARL